MNDAAPFLLVTMLAIANIVTNKNRRGLVRAYKNKCSFPLLLQRFEIVVFEMLFQAGNLVADG